jgi:hypothetical protein
MIMPALVERPQIKVPIPKNTLEKRSPLLREKISVSRPERGWHAALAIK